MKKLITLFIICTLFSYTQAQDIIFLRTKEEMKADVLEILETKVKYKKYENLEGPTYSIDKERIWKIKYENGFEDVFYNNLDEHLYSLNKIKNKVMPQENIDSNSFNIQSKSGKFIDERDGQVYTWVKIGSKVWMSENLKYQTDNGSWCYDNDDENCTKFGRIYNNKTANIACPCGWHLPTNDEWISLKNYLISNGYNFNFKKKGNKIGKALASNSGWLQNDGFMSLGVIGHEQANNNSSGFNGLPGGFRKPNGSFRGIQKTGCWWSPSGVFSIDFAFEGLYYGKSGFWGTRNFGVSARCVKN